MSLLRAIGLKGRLLLTQAMRGAAPFAVRRGAAELALRQSERRLRMIADNLPVLIAYVDHAQYYRFCNRNYERLFGQGRGGLVGKRVRDVLDPASYAVSVAKNEGDANTVPRRADEALYVAKSGGRRTYRVMFWSLRF